jgi:hypothetical protein
VAVVAVLAAVAGCSESPPDEPIVARGTLVGSPGESLRADVLLLAPGDGPAEVGDTVEVPEVARTRSESTGEFTLRLDASDPTLRGRISIDGAVNLRIVAFDGTRQWHCAFSRQARGGADGDASWAGVAPTFELTATGGCEATGAGATAETVRPS